MGKDYSVDDILNELQGNKSASSSNDDEFQKIMDEILGTKNAKINSENKKPQNTAPLKNTVLSPQKAEQHVDEPTVEIKKEKIKPKQETKPSVKEEVKTAAPEQELENTISFDAPVKKADAKKDFKVKLDYEKIMEPEPEVKTEPSEEKQTDSYIAPDFADKTIQMQPFGLDSEPSAQTETTSAGVNEDLVEFRKNRKQKVEKFVLFGEEEEENEPEAAPIVQEAVKTIEDFNDYSESTAIIKDLAGIKAGLSLRIIVLSVLALFSAYVEFGSYLKIPMIEMFNKSTQPLSYLIVSTLVFVAALLVSSPAVFGGVISLFKFKPDSDSFLSILTIGCAVQYVSLFASPNYILGAKNITSIYGFIAVLNMLFNAVGKLTIIRRVRQNFRFVSGGYEKYAVTLPESEKLDNFIKEQFDCTYSSVAIPKKTDFVGSFLSYSYKEDMADNISRILSPCILVGSLVLSVLSFVFTRDFQKSATTFAAVLAISSPISALLTVNLPVLRTTKKISSRGSMISGLAACNEIYDTNSLLVKSSDLFPKGSIQLSAIKTFAAGKIDDVILNAASVVIKAESDLSDVFLSVIGGRKDLLREVDTIVYEEAMGLSAWVDSKRVLIGNRELIRNHGIDVPSKDYEQRYLSSGMDMVYLAESGQLVAVFLIQYKPGTQIKKAMKALKNLGIGVVVVSTDPNINSEKIANIFDIDEDMIRTVPAEEQGEIARLTKPSERENVGAASISSFSAFVQTIYAAIRLRGIASLAVTIQTVGILIGFALAAFFTVTLEAVNVPVGAIALYQAFWLFAVTVVPALRSVKI